LNYIITSKNLEKFYGKKNALNKIDIHIPKAKIYGLLGPNGAGKTTLIGILTGLLKSYKGSFSVNGTIGLMPQDANLYPNMTCWKQLMFLSRLQGISKDQSMKQVVKLLELVGLSDEKDSLVRTLSHGTRRRLELAQSLIGNPDILIFDEPTSGLDPKMSKNIRSLILDLKSKNKTIIFSSHNLYEVNELCDWVCILNEGKIVSEDSISNLTNSKSVLLSVEGVKREVINTINKKSYVNNVKFSSGELEVEFNKVDHTNELIKLLISHNVTINKIKKGQSLENIFLGLVGEK
jgi:ABC-2 type transport system ATP-binding protein